MLLALTNYKTNNLEYVVDESSPLRRICLTAYSKAELVKADQVGLSSSLQELSDDQLLTEVRVPANKSIVKVEE
jgi:hypothetical protein